MRTIDIIKEIENLPVQKRFYVIEQAIRSIRKKEETNLMEKAANVLLQDYKTDYELTVFTNLDFENFYETR